MTLTDRSYCSKELLAPVEVGLSVPFGRVKSFF
jgi:hypothetical protein